MNRICVATSTASAYYILVSRLRRADLPFASVLPESEHAGCGVVLTTGREASRFGEKAMALEDLDADPGVFKGQVVSRLAGGDDVVLVGIDPGTRIGMAVFYGETKLGFDTFDSAEGLCLRVAAFAKRVPARKVIVRVGNGNPRTSATLVSSLRQEIPDATIEVVDESGTSVRSPRMKGVQRDQGAAARIAFRKGEVVSPGNPRSRA